MIRFIPLAGALAVSAFCAMPNLGWRGPFGRSPDGRPEIYRRPQGLRSGRRCHPGPAGHPDQRRPEPSSVVKRAGPARLGDIFLTLLPHSVRSPEFMLRALAATGSASYTISAPGRESAKGAATLVPSGAAYFRAPQSARIFDYAERRPHESDHRFGCPQFRREDPSRPASGGRLTT